MLSASDNHGGLMGFKIVFLNVLLMFVYMACGFGLVKAKKAVASHAKSLSAFLIYVACPCMIVNSFLSMDYSQENIVNIALFFVISFCVQLLFFGLMYVFLHKKFADAKYRVLALGAALGNVGFFGLPVVSALFPEQSVVACYSTLYVTSMNLLVFTVGVFLLTNNKKYVSVKSAILNPTTLSALVAVPLFLFRVSFPDEISSVITLLGRMTTPICMVVLGMRLGSVSLKKLFTRPFVYVVCLMKLIVFPLFAYACVYFLPFADDVFKVSMLVLSSTPTAAVVLSLAELHECEQELSANVVLVTTLFSLVSIPLLMLIV